MAILSDVEFLAWMADPNLEKGGTVKIKLPQSYSVSQTRAEHTSTILSDAEFAALIAEAIRIPMSRYDIATDIMRPEVPAVVPEQERLPDAK